ncbi:hypothetical protein ACFL0V_06050 [Nanoarchaeota archaeon]
MGISDAELQHQTLVQDLEYRLKGRYAIIMREVPVRNPETGQQIGEIDLLGIVDDEWHIYEVKVSDRYRKAERQLLNLGRYLRGCGTISLYYYSGATDKIRKVR